jgi:Raf kinase inhibitor-like YbhB/YbcL family protein
MKTIFATLVVAGVLAVAAVSLPAQGFTLSSPVVSGDPETGFDSGLVSAGRIDDAYAAKDKGPGNPRSFPFTWEGLPYGTQSLALVLDDPDARLVLAAYGMKGDAFLHWIAAEIDPALGGLEDNASASNPPFIQGKNGAGKIGYAAPQPPSDVPKNARKPLTHVYRLTVYALSAPTGLKEGFSLDQLRAAMAGKIIGQARLDFSYSNG